jgi:glyoxylase I family protein
VELTTHIKELEKMLLMQSVRLNAEMLNTLIADEFFEIGISGNVWNKSSLIVALKKEEF